MNQIIITNVNTIKNSVPAPNESKSILFLLLNVKNHFTTQFKSKTKQGDLFRGGVDGTNLNYAVN